MSVIRTYRGAGHHDPYLLFQTARTLRGMNRHAEACAYFADFYQLVPLSGAAYRTGGIVQFLFSLMEIQEYETALAIAEEEKDRLGEYADYHFTCGILYMKAVQADTKKYIAFLPLIEQSYLRCLEIGEVPLHQGVHGCVQLLIPCYKRNIHQRPVFLPYRTAKQLAFIQEII